MADFELKVEKRDSLKKGPSKRLRMEGKIPGILYGSHDKPTPVYVNRKEFETLLHAGGRHSIVNLRAGWRKKRGLMILIKEVQRDPVTGSPIHLDFHHVSLTEKVIISVPILTVGVSIGVSEKGGVLQQVIHEVDVQCLPTEIPEHIELDISKLDVGDSIHVEDLKEMDPRVVTETAGAIVTVLAPVVTPIEEEEEVEEEEAAEPELIERKQKEETEEGE
jgi:large subunit ribosomal protein L25